MSLGAELLGPEALASGFGRDRVFLTLELRRVFAESWHHWIKPGFFLSIWGRFAETTFRTGLGRRAFYKNGRAFITICVGEDVIGLPDCERRYAVASLLHEGAIRLSALLVKKDSTFDAALYLHLVEGALEKYRNHVGPLPLTPAEIDGSNFLVAEIDT